MKKRMEVIMKIKKIFATALALMLAAAGIPLLNLLSPKTAGAASAEYISATPQTGDNFNVWLIVIVMVVAIAALVAAVLLSKRKK